MTKRELIDLLEEEGTDNMEVELTSTGKVEGVGLWGKGCGQKIVIWGED